MASPIPVSPPRWSLPWLWGLHQPLGRSLLELISDRNQNGGGNSLQQLQTGGGGDTAGPGICPQAPPAHPLPHAPPPASEACCELCGLYFENRKALASHARAHLRQFGVTEWCVNGSPIETLSEWIRHRPQKAGAYRSYIQGGRPFTKKFRNSSHARDHDGARRMPLSLQPGGVALLSKGLAADLAHGEPGKILDGGSGGERPMVTSPLSLVKMEEHQRPNIHSESGAKQQRGGSSTGGSWWSTEKPLPRPLCPPLGVWGELSTQDPPPTLQRLPCTVPPPP